MKKLKVLLVCGSGASSGFMATNMRKALSELGIDADIKARSESEIESYIDDLDILMIGPHLKYLMDDIDYYIEGTNVVPILMKPEYYATLDGKKAIEHMLEEYKKGGKEK